MATRVTRAPTNPRVDTVVMSGGAPTSPLMAGFLCSLWERGKTFKNFHTSGAGALMVLLSISPSESTPGEALENWVENGVADDIYHGFPVNFKLFRKPGPFTPIFRRLAERYKLPLLRGQAVPSATNIRDLVAETRALLRERDPVRELLAEWLTRPAHDNPRQIDIDRRRGNPMEQLHAALLNIWRENTAGQLYNRLMRRKDPVKLFRDKWLESVLTTDEHRRVYNDLVDLWFSILTPSTLLPRSEGLAAPLPFLEELVDFDNLEDNIANIDARGGGGHFCVNAYNMSTMALAEKRRRRALTPGRGMRKEEVRQVMELFEVPADVMVQTEPLGPQHIRAAFSMPFIYPPARLETSYYSEGADHEPLNFRHVENSQEHCTVVLLDVLATLEDYLVRRPRDLWDAYVISIMTPVVALAKAAIHEFKEEQSERRASNRRLRRGREQGVVELHKIDWEIPSETQPYIMDWSYSNLATLFDLGKRAGEEFYQDVTNSGRTPRVLIDHPNPP